MHIRRKSIAILYVLILILAAYALGSWVFQRYPISSAHWFPVLCFSAFLIGVDFFEVKTSAGGDWLASSTVDIAVIATLGPAAAMLMEGASLLVGDGLIKRRSPLKVVFNIAMMTFSVGVAGVVFHSLPWSSVDSLSSPLFLIPALVAHMVFSGVNMTLTSTVLVLNEGRTWNQVWRGDYAWHFLSGLLAAPLSAFLIFSYEYAGLWSLLLFGLPLFIIWQSHKLFEDMKEAHINTVAALTTALEADEPYTHGHSYRVAKYAVQIGQRMGMGPEELEELEYAGLLHDIGKIAITNDIVCKPARLTKDEFDILASHPAIGGEIVSQMKFLKGAADLVHHHHERPDGLGYPDGLRDDEVKLGSRILNCCDAIDAMTSNRPYRAALSLEQCMDELRRFKGSQFAVDVVDAIESMYADGSFKVIAQADGTALEIQRILHDAATREAEVPVGLPVG